MEITILPCNKYKIHNENTHNNKLVILSINKKISIDGIEVKTFELHHEKTNNLGFSTRSNTNWHVHRGRLEA